jgi:hypothetical protein
VAAGQAIHGATINLAKGQQVPITVSDAQSLLAKEGTVPGAHLMLGVVAISGAFHTAQISASNAVSRTYVVTIPFDLPINIMICPGAYQLVDSSGAAMPSAGKQVLVTASSSASSASSSSTSSGSTSNTSPSLAFVVKGLGAQ